MLGEGPAESGRLAEPEGSQLKINMVLARLPRLRDPAVDPRDAFAGTFHVNEGYANLEAAYKQAAAGHIPALPPCEVYCHTLTDSSILGAGLAASGAHTLTVFGLHMPARLFRDRPDEAREEALDATLRSINAVLGEPIEDCLLRDGDGEPCLEVKTPVDLEAELGLPGGHIFHGDLAWPFAEDAGEVGPLGRGDTPPAGSALRSRRPPRRRRERDRRPQRRDGDPARPAGSEGVLSHLQPAQAS